MNVLKSKLLMILIMLPLLGCAPTHITTTAHDPSQPLPRPATILVYNFAVSAEEVKLNQGPGARLVHYFSHTPTEAKKLAVAHAAADQLAAALVSELRASGLPAQRTFTIGPIPIQNNMLAISGQFLTLDEGNRLRRLVIGFGVGATEVNTQVQIFSTLSTPPHLVYAFTTSAKSSRKPGIALFTGAGAAAGHMVTSAAVSSSVGIASEGFSSSIKDDTKRTAHAIVKQLIPFFKQQAWIPAKS